MQEWEQPVVWDFNSTGIDLSPIMAMSTVFMLANHVSQ
jgi:hypothetical protein